MKQVYTIGYAGYNSVKEMIDVAKSFHIGCLIDVRSTPYSTYHADFNKEPLAKELRKEGILYRNYANEFGARQKDFINEEGYVDFEAFAASERFSEGVRKVSKAIEMGYAVLLMCAEKDPKDCHRGILIGRELRKLGFEVKHIIGYPPETETQEEMESRCVNSQISMFDPEDPVEKFYREQARKISYRAE